MSWTPPYLILNGRYPSPFLFPIQQVKLQLLCNSTSKAKAKEGGRNQRGTEFGAIKQETRLPMGHRSPSSSSSSSSSTCLCRICHEEEEEGSTGMESPCACAGTLKFAHRDCVQRWCDEKGNNVCEICLQTFEPGYTFSEKKAMADVVVTIRLNHDPQTLGYNEEDNGETGHSYEECSTSSQRGATFCRSMAIMFTVMLLIRHFFAVMMRGSEQYAFGILTVFVLRACGIVIPFYVVMRLIAVVQKAQLQHHLEQHQEGVICLSNREELVWRLMKGKNKYNFNIQSKSVHDRNLCICSSCIFFISSIH